MLNDGKFVRKSQPSGDNVDSLKMNEHYSGDLNTEQVVRICFFSLSLPTKQDCCDVIMRAVTIWGLERGRERVGEGATCV